MKQEAKPMGRVLNALRQIESRNESRPVRVPVAPERTSGETSTSTAASSEPADDLPRDETAMEALLDAAEAAAEQVVAELTPEMAPPNVPEALRQQESRTQDTAVTMPQLKPSRRGAESESPRSDPLGELADAILRSVPNGNPSSFLFTTADSDVLAADLLAPLSMSLIRRMDANLLLIDANLHRPDLASRLGVEASRGLTDVLSGTAGWRDVVRRTVLPGVDVIPAMPFSTPAGPAPNRLQLGRLLAEAKREYRLILVHAASLRYPEVAPMSRDCEGTYLVARLHGTSRRVLRQAGPILRERGVNVLGCIVVR